MRARAGQREEERDEAPRLTTLLPPHSVATLAALLAFASALPGETPFGAPFQKLADAGKEADYGHFAEMLASVMLVREGGVERALEAVPLLHDETHAYIKTVSLMAKDPSMFNLTAWKGMSGASAGKIAGNYTDKAAAAAAADPLVAKFAAKFNGTAPAMDPKANATLNAIATKVGANDDAFIASLNAKLAKYNVVISGKSIGQPTKFNNGAALITRALTGVALAATGVNFAPCLISYAPTGLAVGATAVNVQPVVFGGNINGVAAVAQGVNLQPVLILIQPIGANVQPQGFQVAPFLIAVSPLGANVQPQGMAVGPAAINIGPTGKAIIPQGKVVAPVDTAFSPVDINITPPAPPSRR